MACLLTNREKTKILRLHLPESGPARLLPNAGHTMHSFLVVFLQESLGAKFGVKLGRGLGVVDSGGLSRHGWRELTSPCLYHLL